MTTTAAHEAVGAIASLEALDEPARKVGKTVRDAVPAGPVKDALSGTWLGHALHPLLTDLPIGAWTSAVMLDWLGGERCQNGADRLVALGLAAALRVGDLPEGESRYAEVGGVGVLVARHEGNVYALSNRCVHRGGPLDEG